jgi:hypothetical protein
VVALEDELEEESGNVHSVLLEVEELLASREVWGNKPSVPSEPGGGGRRRVRGEGEEGYHHHHDDHDDDIALLSSQAPDSLP